MHLYYQDASYSLEQFCFAVFSKTIAPTSVNGLRISNTTFASTNYISYPIAYVSLKHLFIKQKLSMHAPLRMPKLWHCVPSMTIYPCQVLFKGAQICSHLLITCIALLFPTNIHILGVGYYWILVT